MASTPDKEASSFENLMQNLESMVTRLESDDLPLEEAIDTYYQGIKLAKEGHERLAAAERRIEEVTRGGNRPVEAEAILGEEV